MGSSRTENEINAENIRVLGKEFGDIYNAIYKEILSLDFQWYQFLDLFTNKSNIETMNKCAPLFFYYVQQCFRESIILGISRLTDPKQTGKKTNLSIQVLPDYVEDLELKIQLKKSINEILQNADGCRDWRNRWISHKDRLVATNKHVEKLKKTDQKSIQTVITGLEELINIIEDHFFNSSVAFHWMNKSEGSAVLSLVEDGYRFDGLKYKWHLNKTFTEEDFGE